MHPFLTRHEPMVRRSLLMLALYASPLVIALSLSSNMYSPGLWIHLTTGRWVIENGAFPDLELFSLNPTSEHWVAYSWLFDILVYGLHEIFGLKWHILFASVMALTLAFVLYGVLDKLSNRVALSVVLTVLGIIAMAGMLHGRSAIFSYIFMLLELYVLYQAVLWRRHRLLFALPVLFALWANLHIQFIYGLFVYACFTAQAVLDYFDCMDTEEKQRYKRLLYRLFIVGFGCLAATLSTPYPLGTYETLFLIIKDSGALSRLSSDLQPPAFRSLDSFAFLFLVLATTWVIGRKRIDKPFWLLLFVVAVVLGFRSIRDIWFAVVTGLPLIALAYANTGAAREQPRPNPFIVIFGLGVIAYAWFAFYDIRETPLRQGLAKRLPVDAVEFIAAQDYPGPLYNYYDWGGFLLWNLPQRKVSIDDRAHVHGAGYIKHTVHIWNALEEWKNDPELAAAGIIIGPKKLPLSKLLAYDARFKQVYQDNIAVVFIPSAHKSKPFISEE